MSAQDTPEDTSSPYIDDVKAFLEEVKENSPEEPESPVLEQDDEQEDSDTWEEPIPDDLFSSKEEEPEEDDEDSTPEIPSRIHLQTDTSFIDDQLEDMSNLYKVTVKAFEYKITMDDKETYLRCMLTDSPVILQVVTAGSSVGITCRALSVHEIELATYAGVQYMKNAADPYMAELSWRSEVQKYRLAMQVMQIGRDKIDYLSYKPDPGNLHEQAMDLQRKATERFGSMNIIRWRLCVHALNVFEHKLTRLNELALMPDFLSPDE